MTRAELKVPISGRLKLHTKHRLEDGRSVILTNNDSRLDQAQQIEEMWTTYESVKISDEHKNTKQLIGEMLTFEGDEITGNETEEPNDSTVEEFASSEDIRGIIDEEIEQKLEWAQANACRAYVGSTF